MTGFQTTRWSLVLQARQDDGGARALAELCRVYRPPVLAWLLGRRYPAAEAEDLTQGFFEQLLRLRTHARADRERGRFRVFLLVALKNFVANQRSAAAAAKRGGGRGELSLDAAQVLGQEPSAGDDELPDREFERAFAKATVAAALARLQAEAVATGKGELFAALRPYLLETPERDAYAELSQTLGLRRNTLAVAIHRLRHRLQELVRQQVADTLETPEQVEAELTRLRGSLGSPRPVP